MRTLDLFSGAGGSSWGAARAGATIVAGVDASEPAMISYARNFPTAKAFCHRIEILDPARVRRQIGNIELLLASPECTNHSPAKGKAPRCEDSKRTAMEVIRFADALRPRWVVIENVVNMRRWSRYEELLNDLRAIGYHVRPLILNAVDFGVPQTRRRLFVIADRLDEPNPPAILPMPPRAADEIVQINAPFRWRLLNSPQRAKGTLMRAERAIATLGNCEPFILVYYGSDGSGGWQRLARPLRTITTLDRFAIVRPTSSGHEMRMLQVPELKSAMGMSRAFVAGIGSRRDQIRAIGNAVCPPVMRSVVRALTASR